MKVEITNQQAQIDALLERYPKNEKAKHQKNNDVANDAAFLPVEEISPSPSKVLNDVDRMLIEQAMKRRKFAALYEGNYEACRYPSQSEADMALANDIAYYTDDPAQIDRIFRHSGLMREKWDERRGEQTYGQWTVQKAASSRRAEEGRRRRALSASASRIPMYGITAPAVQMEAPPFGLAELTAMAMFKGDPPTPQYLVERMFPMGKVVILASPPGIGKSMLGLELAHAVSRSPSALMPDFAFGGRVCAHGRVVVISAEDDKDEMHRRLNAMKGRDPMSNKLHIISLPDLGHFTILEGDPRRGGMAPTARWDRLVQEIDDLGDIKLIIIDTLQAMSHGDLNAAEVAQAVMNELTELANRTGATVLVLHHLVKGTTWAQAKVLNAQTAMDAIRGSSAIAGSARAAYCMFPHPKAQEICETLAIKYEENKVVCGLIAKANGDARRDKTIFVRNESGVLVDRTMEIRRRTKDEDAGLEDELLHLVVQAHHGETGFACSVRSKNGVYNRRHELPEEFHDKPKAWFDERLKALVVAGKLCEQKVKNGAQYIPGDVLGLGKAADNDYRDRDGPYPDLDVVFDDGQPEAGNSSSANGGAALE